MKFTRRIKNSFFAVLVLLAAWALLFIGVPRSRAVSCGFGSDNGSGQCVGFITSGTSWTVPSDWGSTNEIEVIGGGGGGASGGGGKGGTGGQGGGGGAYAEVNNVTGLSGTVTVQIGAGGATDADGTATFFNGSSCSTASVCADFGTTAGTGGATGNSVGTVKYAGGAGAAGGSGLPGGGGGGAAGPNGAGGAGSSSTGGTGDNGTTAAGANGTEWSTSPAYGAGGGGAGAASGNGSNGGTYGAGGGGGQGGGSSGGSGQPGIIVITYTPYPGQPGTPTYSGQSASTPGDVTVGWSAGTNTTYYNLDYATSAGGPFSFVASTTATSTGVTGLSPNTTYWFEVQGASGSDTGIWSATSSVLTYPGQPGAAPTYSGQSASAPGNVTVGWSAPSGGATYYNVDYATSAGGPFSFAASTTATSAGVTGLSGNTTYWFEVQAVNGTGAGLWSATSSVLTYPSQPASPTYLSATTSSLEVSWSPPTGGATYYNLDYATSASGPFSFVASTTATNHTQSSLSVNTQYWYEVQGVNSVGAGSWSASSSQYTLANTPGAPTVGSPSTSTLTISNNANGNPSGTTFAIQVTSTIPTDSNWNGNWVDSNGSSSPTPVWMTNSVLTNLIVKNLQSNTSYAFTAEAKNGNSTTTAEGPTASGTTKVATPSSPGTPTYSNVETSTLTVGWSPPTGGATYYNLDYATSASGPFSFVASTTATSTGVTGLSLNTQYWYEVQGVNDSGPGSWSATSSVITLPGQPGTPSYSSVEASTLTASWTAPSGGAAYYNLDYATAASGPFSFAASTTATSTGVTGLSPNTQYWFEVQGVNGTGGGGAWSATSSVTTTSNSPPNAPSENAPANGIQDVSVTPVFQMTATDPDSDSLQYKVTIYNNSACTTSYAIQTDDETSSQTGWSGQNATCVSGSDCYTSGSQGTYTVQSALSANTIYYWKASAIDPLGTDTWTDSTSCNSFTTSYGNWTTDSGDWSISGGALTITPAAGSNAQLHATGQSLSNAMVDVEVEASAVGAGTGNTGIALRADSGSNRYQLAEADAENSLHKIGKLISGAYTSLTSAAFTWNANTFYDLRAYISGSTLQSWVNGATALSTTDSSLGSAGFVGLEASSTNGTVKFTYKDFAVYTSPTITMNNLPSGGSWAVLTSTSSVIACETGSTWDLSTYGGQVPVDYDNGGGSVAIWTGNSTCNGSSTATYPGSGLATDIFGGDTYTYSTSTVNTGGAVESSSTISVNSVGLISY